MALYDLLVRGGTCIDPSQGLHADRDVAFAQGVVAAVGEDIPSWQADHVIDASGHLVTPGMVDLHVHIFEGVSHYGIAPDPYCLAKGVTTAVDAGSAGADTFLGFRKYVVEVSDTRIYANLNISSQGMISSDVGELDEIRWANVDKALQTIEANRDLILGVKVRLSRGQVCSERSGLEPLHRARQAADAAGLPIMVHPQGAWCESLDDVLAVMGEGDIVTHCFHGRSHGILDGDRRIRSAVREARERGVLFDVGHGSGSFDWSVCEAALAQGFPPTTISSDLHVYNINGPVYDLATTVTKFLELGMPLEDALSRVTAVPAGVIGMGERLGTLRPGAHGDAVVFDVEEGEFPLADSAGQVRHGRRRLVPHTVIKAGHVYKGDRHHSHRHPARPHHHHH